MADTLGAHTDPTRAGALPVAAFVGDIVNRIDPQATLLEVADALAAAEVGALLIAERDSAHAIVSERDLVHALASRQDPATTTAGDIGHTKLIWCDINATVGEVALKMMEAYVRHILVDEDGRLAGIISARDLLGAYAADELARSDDDW